MSSVFIRVHPWPNRFFRNLLILHIHQKQPLGRRRRAAPWGQGTQVLHIPLACLDLCIHAALAQLTEKLAEDNWPRMNTDGHG